MFFKNKFSFRQLKSAHAEDYSTPFGVVPYPLEITYVVTKYRETGKCDVIHVSSWPTQGAGRSGSGTYFSDNCVVTGNVVPNTFLV